MKTIVITILAIFAIMPFAFATLSGPSPIPPPPNFNISAATTYLCKGEINNVAIAVNNKGSGFMANAPTPNTNGTTMQNLQLNLVGSKYLSSVGTINVGNINPGSNIIAHVPVFVYGNASSIISAQIPLSYYYLSLYQDTETRNLTFSVDACPLPLSLNVTPYVFTAGSIENISINLTNHGATTLNAISMHLSIPSQDAALLISQPIQVNSIKPDSSVVINASLFMSKNASDTFPINISANFYNGTQLNQIYSNFPVLSTGIINLTQSTITISPDIVSSGGIFSISFILTNIGTATASAATAAPILPSGFKTFGENTVFIGDIGTDSQTPVTLTLTASNTSKGAYNIPIKVNYLNSLRQNEVFTFTVPVYVSGAEAFNATGAGGFKTRSSGGSGYFLTTIIFLLATIILGYLYYKERKRHPK